MADSTDHRPEDEVTPDSQDGAAADESLASAPVAEASETESSATSDGSDAHAVETSAGEPVADDSAAEDADALAAADTAPDESDALPDETQAAPELEAATAASDVEDSAAAEADAAPAADDSVDEILADDAESTDGLDAESTETAGDDAQTPADDTLAASGVEGEPASDDAAGGLDDGEQAEEDFKRPAAEVKSIVEALIFASPDPLTPKALLKLLDSEPKEDVLAALEELKQDYERPGGLQLVEVAGGFQLVTRADLHEWVRRLFHERSTQKLSVQALESLAVIAYRQPITAIEITEIRGVNTSGVLNTLLERHLIKIVGRKQVVGRPFMYATTKEFLIRFGLKDLADLPKVEDMAESLGIESRLLVEQTPPEEQLPLSEPESDELPYDSVGADAEGADFASVDDTPADDDPGPSVH